MSQAAARRFYQIGPSPDEAINGLFEGHAEPRLRGLSCLFMGKSTVRTATSRLDINRALARVVLLAKHLYLLLLVSRLDIWFLTLDFWAKNLALTAAVLTL